MIKMNPCTRSNIKANGDQMTSGLGCESVKVSRSGAGSLWLLLAAASILFFAMLNVFWVGFLASDDVSYWQGSTGWLRHFPYLGGDHWTLRHTLVIPIALARLVFGDSPTPLFLPTILYAEGLVAVTGIWIWRSAGPLVAAIALLFIVTYPQVIIYSSTADIDIIELFFVFCAFSLLGSVVTNVGDQTSISRALSPSDRRKLFLSGIFLGLALLSRETAVFAILAVTLLCLMQFRLARKYYLYIFVGAAVVIGLEILYLWSQSGNLFYRYSLVAHHDSNIDRWRDQGAAIPFVHPAIDPFTMLLLNHNFGLVSWIAVPLSIWLYRRDDLQNGERVLVVLLGTLALAWATLSAALWTSLVLIPRYYLLPAVCVLVLAALALSRMWRSGLRWTPIILGVLLVASNLMALALDNRNYVLGEYKLVELAKQQNRTIHTDPQTLHRAERLLEWAGISERVTAAPFGPGDLVFVNPLRSRSGTIPGPDWKLLYESPIPQSGGHLIACNLPRQVVPKAMLGAVACHRDTLRLYKVGTTR